MNSCVIPAEAKSTQSWKLLIFPPAWHIKLFCASVSLPSIFQTSTRRQKALVCMFRRRDCFPSAIHETRSISRAEGVRKYMCACDVDLSWRCSARVCVHKVFAKLLLSTKQAPICCKRRKQIFGRCTALWIINWISCQKAWQKRARLMPDAKSDATSAPAAPRAECAMLIS